jgi:hypothetical protein
MDNCCYHGVFYYQKRMKGCVNKYGVNLCIKFIASTVC